jgi:hypothetical protein
VISGASLLLQEAFCPVEAVIDTTFPVFAHVTGNVCRFAEHFDVILTRVVLVAILYLDDWALSIESLTTVKDILDWGFQDNGTRV